MLDLNKLCGMNGKTAIVTGAASGIGAGIARFFADAGVSVVIADINEELARKVEKEINDAGGHAEFIRCDVTKEADCKAVADAVAAKYPRIDILVNCAGVARRRTVETLEEKDWDLALNVTLKSVFLMSKHVVPYMKKAGGGKIVNIGSGWALKGGDHAVSYCAAKGGVWNMTRAMAIDHGPDNINVNCISPGMVVGAASIPHQGTWLGRTGEPREIAALVVFLASDDSSFITGENHTIDGGRVLGVRYHNREEQ